jgi:DNA repair photolyase
MYVIDQVWVDREAMEYPLTERIIKASNPARVLVGSEILNESARVELAGDPFRRGKRILKLTRYKGSFVKPCPGTKTYVCCGLHILNIGQGCPIDCRYCALQVYFNNPVMEIYVNLNEMFDELREFLDKAPRDRFFRFCTGEFTDSLALDPFTGLAEELLQLFASRTNASLEFKTKSDFITPLLKSNSHGNIIVSFSMNAPSFSKTEEIRSSSLSQRLKAAASVVSEGFRVGFHFDPIVPFDGWERGYGETIDSIFSTVKPESIAWISMGVLRFVPELKDIVMSRFGPVSYFCDSFAPGLDGKSRLSRDRRIVIYKTIAERIRSYGQNILLYLCMESPLVWSESLGLEMRNNDELAGLLDDAAGKCIRK